MTWLNDLQDDAFAEALAQAKANRKQWEDERPAGGFKRVPDGKHTFLITSARVSDDKPMIQFDLRVESFEDRHLTKTIWLGGNLQYPIGEFLSLGIEVGSKKDMIDAVPTMVGMRVAGAVRTKPGKTYSDIFFNSLIERVENVDAGGFDWDTGEEA